MRHNIIQRLLLIVISGVSWPTIAAEWSVEPRISLRSGYNDNIRLTTGPHDSVWESSLTPAVKFGVATENNGLFGNASASVRRFTGGSGANSSSLLDREDYQLRTNAYQRSELNEISGTLDLTRDSTLDSELDETGRVIQDRASRTRISLSPSWARLINEKTRLSLSYSFTNVSYSDEIGVPNLIEYDYEVLSASLTRQFTPKLQGTISSSFSTYKPEIGYDSETMNLQIGLTRNFSETLSTSWLAGVRETSSDTPISTGFCVGADDPANFPACSPSPPGIAIQTGAIKDESKNSGSAYSANITKILERGKLTAALSRSSNPSGDGQLLDTTRLILFGEHKFSETFKTSMSVEYSNAETIVNTSGQPNRQTDEDFFRVKPKLFWQWRQEWLLSAEYEYTENDNNNSSSDTATRNAFYLTLSYHQPKIAVSR